MKKFITIFASAILLLQAAAFAEQVQLNKPQFSANTVTVSGSIPEEYVGQKITLQVIKPKGTLGDYQSIYYIREFDSNLDGSFEFSLDEPTLSGEYLGGSYRVYVGSKGLETAELNIDHDIINVLDYGALNDASDDASNAIQNAVETAYSCGGTVVYLPQGEYLIQNQVNLKSGITLTGSSGTKLILDGAGFSINEADKVVIDGLEFSGSGTVLTASASENITLKNIKSSAAILDSADCTGVTVSLCAASAAEGTAVKVCGGDVTIKDSLISGFESLLSADGGRITLQSCMISGGKIDLKSCNQSSVWNSQLSGVQMTAGECDDIRISGNVFSEQSMLSLCGGNRNVKIESNVFNSKEAEFEMLKIGGDKQEELIYINSNKFWYGAAADGLSCGEGICFVNIRGVNNMMLQGNYICNTAVTISDVSELDYSGNMQVLENILAEDEEMLLLENVTDSGISRNSIITDNETAEQSVLAKGIEVSEGCSNITVRDNKISGFAVSVNLAGEKNGINIHGNYADFLLSDNQYAASVYNNRSLYGLSLELSYITEASEGSRYFHNSPTDFLGSVFINGRWRGFEPISDDTVKSLTIEQSDSTVNAVYTAYDIVDTDVMITAVYDDTGKLIDTIISSAETAEEIKGTVLLEDLSKSYTVRCFLWNGTGSVKPIYYTREIQTEIQSETEE
ncbi:MAG: hypothetical protein J6C82_08270 [Clostridia bacterium]|nr:hypothetical protein [Clostridia bacterium]MBP3360249.1 hypothetical protein [Clostridia bacterium]